MTCLHHVLTLSNDHCEMRSRLHCALRAPSCARRGQCARNGYARPDSLICHVCAANNATISHWLWVVFTLMSTLCDCINQRVEACRDGRIRRAPRLDIMQTVGWTWLCMFRSYWPL